MKKYLLPITAMLILVFLTSIAYALGNETNATNATVVDTYNITITPIVDQIKMDELPCPINLYAHYERIDSKLHNEPIIKNEILNNGKLESVECQTSQGENMPKYSKEQYQWKGKNQRFLANQRWIARHYVKLVTFTMSTKRELNHYLQLIESRYILYTTVMNYDLDLFIYAE